MSAQHRQECEMAGNEASKYDYDLLNSLPEVVHSCDFKGKGINCLARTSLPHYLDNSRVYYDWVGREHPYRSHHNSDRVSSGDENLDLLAADDSVLE